MIADAGWRDDDGESEGGGDESDGLVVGTLGGGGDGLALHEERRELVHADRREPVLPVLPRQVHPLQHRPHHLQRQRQKTSDHRTVGMHARKQGDPETSQSRAILIAFSIIESLLSALFWTTNVSHRK